jgi:purine-binding chemotaxis protein CheW
VKRQLAAAEAALARDFAPPPEQQRELMRRRTRQLAQIPAPMLDTDGEVGYVEFMLGTERYAVEAASVREVLPLKDITPLPGTPAHVAGVINVHGRIVTALDLRGFFGLPPQGLTDFDKLILLHEGAVEFGLLADRIVAAGSLRTDELQPPLATHAGMRGSVRKGIGPHGLALLDASRLLTDNALVVDQAQGP